MLTVTRSNLASDNKRKIMRYQTQLEYMPQITWPKEQDSLEYNRVNSLTLNPACPKASQLKTLLDSRDNRAIIQHLNANQHSEDLADLYHFAVLHLTCNNDPDTLEEVLRWGRTEGLQPQWKEEEDCQCSENPIMVASQQVSL